ncbi:unnamed protein product (macronuclear) [Paramecium tetraurelia]|uniref:Uncharacterized protein n=1 Tax=Paramecium tetraurelia TaxID=5888 RepID=A0E2V4_PARTE|nr:uncharacterized protein GSPATT00022793001 [Paramecium tetraurelia]CAK89621.1 unnamed protein product [Paramecium tetraurelia]|eukprot:XP_001457018.1 hypothetical protein (macronuclear) [Paramecium tetraurelia strain d4-2]
MVEQLFSNFLGFYKPNFKMFTSNTKFREKQMIQQPKKRQHQRNQISIRLNKMAENFTQK